MQLWGSLGVSGAVKVKQWGVEPAILFTRADPPIVQTNWQYSFARAISVCIFTGFFITWH